MKSKCCKADLTIFTGSEGTNHWICSRCGQPADPMQNKPQLSAEMETNRIIRRALNIGTAGNWNDRTEKNLIDDLNNEIAGRLATALEEQKKDFLMYSAAAIADVVYKQKLDAEVIIYFNKTIIAILNGEKARE